MTKVEKVLIAIIIILFLIGWIYFIHLRDKRIDEYGKRCDRIGWEICEKEFYDTHYENGMEK